MTRRSTRSESGLVGVRGLVSAIVVVLVAIAVVDGGSIGWSFFRLNDLARQAAAEGAVAYRDLRDVRRSELVVAAYVAERDDDARVVRTIVDQSSGEVTVTVERVATTILAGRIPATRRFATVRTTERSLAPPSG